MNRRSAIKTGGMALLGLGFGGCRTCRPSTAASRDRAPRSTSRPFTRPGIACCGRPSACARTARRVSSCGPKSSTTRPDPQLRTRRRRHVARWGMRHARGGVRAADQARRAAVIGCGSPGLTAARQLQRRGFDVTIYAMTVPPDTTSNMSLAGFTPSDRADRQGSADAGVGRAVPARR